MHGAVPNIVRTLYTCFLLCSLLVFQIARPDHEIIVCFPFLFFLTRPHARGALLLWNTRSTRAVWYDTVASVIEKKKETSVGSRQLSISCTHVRPPFPPSPSAAS